MRIACPACQAEYDVPEGMLEGHAAVRCARCRQEWQPIPADPAFALPTPLPDTALRPAEPLSTALEPTAARDIAEPLAERDPAGPPAPLFAPPRVPGSSQEMPRGSAAVTLGAWIATLIVLAGLAAGGYLWRDRLMTAWPPSTRLYAALGLR